MSGEPTIPVTWIGSEFAQKTLRVDGIEHGYAGGQRVFSIQNRPLGTFLHTYLPRPDGRPFPREEFTGPEKAKGRAAVILQGFLIHLLAPDTARKVS
ncbi:hypothetical protein [Nonomuraea longicatena]|uniref:Uncharacterized protein n=1 Tax=Nonomuraea longicatena TaxID=83682 RepID=A0ABP3Z5X2_9ACTN